MAALEAIADEEETTTEEVVEASPVELPEIPETSMDSETAVETAENLFKDNEDEVKSLASALDAAFANLTGESLKDESELKEGHNNIDELSSDIDKLTDDIVEQGNDLDLDLSFLKEDENTSETNSEH